MSNPAGSAINSGPPLADPPGGQPSERRLLFYYDVVCPYAYLGSTRVEALAARAGVPLVLEPILLGGVFRAIGAPDVPAEQMSLAKARLNLLDMQRYAALHGVPLALHPRHPRRSVEAMRLCHLVDGTDRARLMHALYRAYFGQQRDLADRAVLADVLFELGLPRALAERGIDDEAPKAALRATTDRAIADGVFGVPAFVIVTPAGRRLFWGQDRMHLVEAALGR
jgi:2-hydroxychromene-2-carboxylate isomerase